MVVGSLLFSQGGSELFLRVVKVCGVASLVGTLPQSLSTDTLLKQIATLLLGHFLEEGLLLIAGGAQG